MPAVKVSIITRTRDREAFLKRAARSVLGQQEAPPWEWIVVNDGGDAARVEAVLAPDRPRLENRLRICHLGESRGMEHASNAGIARARGELLVIHDDDDRWDPAFLHEMSGFLDQSGNKRYAGVVCHSIRVVERMVDGVPVETHRHPFNPGLQALSFWELLQENRFPPISFLFRRALLEGIGPFNEDLPVLGDWEFNLRAVARYPLAVHPRPLAFYHHREAVERRSQANSITAGDARHREVEAGLRRQWQEHNPFGAPPEIMRHAAPLAGSLHRMRTGLRRLVHATAQLPKPPPPQF